MFTAACMSWSLCPLLTQGAINMLSAHGTEDQKALYLPPMATGTWTGTMNLTEPQAGSDLGAVAARALPQPDGSYRLHGTKIFITYGEHDLADNIVHLVLARTPDAPPGTRGISCFLVPKHLPAEHPSSPGVRNDVRCVSIEHKLGIHASPTCVMAYGDDEGAVGFLVGEENGGMRAMFTMMNHARLSVGLEGVAIAERSYQQALAYARERRQGRAPGAPKGESSAIIDHPDVRRMLLDMRSSTGAMRGLAYRNAEAIDRAAHGADAPQRQAADEQAALLTPLTKAWATDMGCELVSVGLQVHGGMGFIEETGAAQHYRDARIAPIYEGDQRNPVGRPGRPQAADARRRGGARPPGPHRGHRRGSRRRRGTGAGAPAPRGRAGGDRRSRRMAAGRGVGPAAGRRRRLPEDAGRDDRRRCAGRRRAGRDDARRPRRVRRPRPAGPVLRRQPPLGRARAARGGDRARRRPRRSRASSLGGLRRRALIRWVSSPAA